MFLYPHSKLKVFIIYIWAILTRIIILDRFRETFIFQISQEPIFMTNKLENLHELNELS